MTPEWMSWMPIFFDRQLKTIDVRGDEVEHQQRADEIAAGQEERDSVPEHIESEDEPLAEVARLRVVKPLVHLRERADEHEQDRERQQNHREPQRDEDIDQPVNERSHSLPTG
jgi:hypothetical protein